MIRVQLRFSALSGVALLVAGLSLPARAQQDPDDSKRGVGRISLMNGQVSVQRGDSGEWVAGVINAPLIAGDRIATGPSSRAEIQFDSSAMFRMGANAEVHLTQLEAARYQMEFAKGILTFRVLRPTDAALEVDTPSVSVRPAKVGSYRLSVNEAGETEVTARAGDVEVFSPRGSQWVSTGQTLIARGDPADPEYQIVAAVGMDDWDRWNVTRDQSLMQSPSDQYVGPGVSGAEDLDGYGTWTNVPDYGPCWRPTVAVDWAPYRHGRWSWLDWYGWTWVPDDPWGWAPYHYGRWFYESNYGWMWYPGVRGARHYWSPALVAFFGFGGGGFNVGFGFGFGHVGWVPLAPYEVFHPWWGRGYYGGLNRNINITNVNITSVYRNARIGNGASSVGAEDFRNGRFGAIGRPGAEELRGAGLIHGQVGIAPSHSNLQYGAHAAAFTPRTSGTTKFFTHQQPTAVQRVPFAQQQRAMGQGSQAAGPGLPGRTAGVANDRPATATGGVPRPGAGAQPAPMNRPNGAVAGGASVNNGTNGGYRRFGDPGGQASNPGAASGAGRNPNPAYQNTRPAQQPTRGFGSPGTAPAQPQYNAPRQPQYGAPQNRPSQPTNSAPSYSAPSRAPAPSYSPPARSGGSGGGGGGGSTRPSGGGSSGGHSSGGGGRRR